MSSRIAPFGLILIVLATGLLWPRAIPAQAESGLADLAWLAGHWRTERDGTVTEELWTSAEGGMMLGLNRQFRPGGRTEFEYLRIEEGPEGVDYVASPGGGPPTRFQLARAGERSAAFQNAKHDWPQVIEYRLDDAGVMHVRAAGLAAGSHELTWTMLRKGSE